ncbi:MAG: NAD(P)/FAD-dependent oxidoreductase [Acidimicrobiales bacterium]
MNRIVVVGAGLAGLRACEGLRARDFQGEIVLVGEEDHDPYDRPPLSKQFLSGEWDLERLWLRKKPEMAALDLEVRKGADHRADRLELEPRSVTLGSGERLSFDGLVIATGARARTLRGFEALPGAYVLRTIDDSRKIRSVLARTGLRLLVIGAGFIGMEVAATARKLGCEVTVVEPLKTPLARVLGPLAGRACQALHEAHGVRLIFGSVVESVSAHGADGPLTAILDNGTTLEADAVLLGVGAAPNVSWLEGSGLDVGPEGLRCDGTLRAAPGVVAAGDLVSWPFGAGGASVRLEHRTNAAEQGDHAAGTLLGSTDLFDTVPYVWSDQYDAKIQVLGIPKPDDECVVVDGSTKEGRFVALYARDGLLSAAVAFSMPRSLMAFRTLLKTPTRFSEALSGLG